MVRNKIKMFAQKKVTLPPGRHKVVILDEADRYTGTCRCRPVSLTCGMHTDFAMSSMTCHEICGSFIVENAACSWAATSRALRLAGRSATAQHVKFTPGLGVAFGHAAHVKKTL